MIIVRIMGGLGNQMFQYAAARSISISRNIPLKLDTTFYKNKRDREYGLSAFNIVESFASNNEIRWVRWQSLTGIKLLIYKVIQKLKPPYQRKTFRELKSGPYRPEIRKTVLPLYLDGYWQSEKYFENIGETIKAEFSLRSSVSEVTLALASEMRRESSVSIHVRRGDYVKNQKVRKIRDVCNQTYYQNAISYISSQVSLPHFFVFSDDPIWVQNNIFFKHPVFFVLHNGTTNAFEDLWLMSQCNHNIIANSTFSWWGAWLNCNPSKKVCAPSKWFNNRNMDTRDLIPKEWIRISND